MIVTIRRNIGACLLKYGVLNFKQVLEFYVSYTEHIALSQSITAPWTYVLGHLCYCNGCDSYHTLLVVFLHRRLRSVVDNVILT